MEFSAPRNSTHPQTQSRAAGLMVTWRMPGLHLKGEWTAAGFTEGFCLVQHRGCCQGSMCKLTLVAACAVQSEWETCAPGVTVCSPSRCLS